MPLPLLEVYIQNRSRQLDLVKLPLALFKKNLDTQNLPASLNLKPLLKSTLSTEYLSLYMSGSTQSQALHHVSKEVCMMSLKMENLLAN